MVGPKLLAVFTLAYQNHSTYHCYAPSPPPQWGIWYCHNTEEVATDFIWSGDITMVMHDYMYTCI